VKRLQSYSWPGNVRELQNIIERAMITSRDGRLNLDRALPESGALRAIKPPESSVTMKNVHTAKEFEELERNNIIAALEASRWKVAGQKGAAQLLGVKPTTLSSRIRALGIERKQ
jgi:formate hydrogenlyase transcriptional activator